jgi:hypothetical protein
MTEPTVDPILAAAAAVGHNRQRLALIAAATANVCGVSYADVLSDRRDKKAVLARQLAMRLAKKLTRHSLPEIGRAYNRDHTTVLHALMAWDYKLSHAPEMADLEQAALRDLALIPVKPVVVRATRVTEKVSEQAEPPRTNHCEQEAKAAAQSVANSSHRLLQALLAAYPDGPPPDVRLRPSPAAQILQSRLRLAAPCPALT